jgi:glycosyltransferase involved in cell wall biosynthesis
VTADTGMTVLHVLPSIDPALGGAVESARLIARAMSRLGVSVEVLSLETPALDILRNWPVKVHSLGRTFSYYQYSAELVSWLERNHADYDAVIVHGVWRYASVGVWRALGNTSTPYFVFTHGMLDPWFEQAYPLKHIKKTVFWRMFEHRVLRDARAVLFTCEEERALACQSFQPFQCREQVVGMGTGEPPRDAAAQREEFLGRFPHLRDKRIILFISRIHRKKGCDLLIRAFGKIASVDPRLHLVMAGPDENGWQAELERLAVELGIADRVTWTGHLYSKWGAFRAAEVFALTSHSENYGQAVVEAMACELAVLITNKVNIWQEIADDDAGLIGNDDLDGAVSLLEQWISLSTARQREMAANAGRSYRNRFEMEGFTRRFIDYLAHETSTEAEVAARVAIHG